MKVLVAIPVFNEERHVRSVLERVLKYTQHVVMIDDGSTDGTTREILDFPVDVIRHSQNRGYGSAMRDAFQFAAAEGFDWLITMDCDDQHEPAAIPHFTQAALEEDAKPLDGSMGHRADIISGSRYLLPSTGDDRPPAERRAINQTITAEINARLSDQLGTLLTDGFCGFKAYRVSAIRKLRPKVRGYAFPMQFWAQAAAAGLRVRELPVRLIYNDLTRTFGGQLDDAEIRLQHYRQVFHKELVRQADKLPAKALCGILAESPACSQTPPKSDGSPSTGRSECTAGKLADDCEYCGL
jgi:glycosyltransferase involved in cell wall biosynthesis